MAVRELEILALPQSADPPRGPMGELVERFVGPFFSVDPPEPRTPAGFYTDTTVCIGCKACEVACKHWNQLSADGLRWTGNSYDNTETLSATSWRHVTFIEQFPQVEKAVTLESLMDGSVGDGAHTGRWLMMSDVCKHCTADPCQHACPTGAIIYNEFSNVYIQPDICNGCSSNIAA
jgi:formate dehydrogenase iron-sulfur subunit